MKNRKRFLIISLSLILVACLAVFLIFRNTVFFHQIKQDLLGAPSIETEQEINNIISKLEKVPISKLP